MSAKWFPESEYKAAHDHAVQVARSFGGKFEVGLEKFAEFGKAGYRAGFLLPNPQNRQGFELRCQVVRATDPLSLPVSTPIVS